MNSTPIRVAGASDHGATRTGRALVVRHGALGDVLLTRRLCHSLFLAGFRSSLLAPARHAILLLTDPWIDAVLDSESPRFAPAFAGSWPAGGGSFDVAVLISNSAEVEKAVGSASARVIRLSPTPGRFDQAIARQWTEAARFAGPGLADIPLLDMGVVTPIITGAVLIHPGSGSPAKNWPLERFTDLSRALEGRGHRVHWIRGPAESEVFPGIPPEKVIDRPSLPALAATLGASMLFVGNDSGVSHLAGAVGAPALVLFGPTDPVVWRPEGPRVRTMRAPSGDLTAISVEEVIAASEDVARLRNGGMPFASAPRW